ncbi:uncharacterized protein LOC141609493 [Silene latifolia]|uniref:uncharacterized protein LOC141609493 n=1 Tax=Silene latifolia TaxID=37657 RepID=UPI003D781317
MARIRVNPRQSCGRIVKASRNSWYWIKAQRIVNDMAEDSHKDKMDSPPVGPVSVVKLSVQGVAGLLYFITFRVIGENGLSTDYTTDVWRKPGSQGIKISSFAKVEGSEREVSSEIFEEKKSSEGKEGLDLFKGLSTPVQTGNTDVIQGNNESSKLRIHGFHILLEQIRSQRPSLKYAMARKWASTSWRKLSENEKMIFMGEAAKRLNKQ